MSNPLSCLGPADADFEGGSFGAAEIRHIYYQIALQARRTLLRIKLNFARPVIRVLYGSKVIIFHKTKLNKFPS